MSQATINWGDGTANSTVPIVGTVDDWHIDDAPHTYADGGDYTITLTGPGGDTETLGISLPNTPDILGFSVAEAATGTSITIPRPAEAASGTHLLAFVRGQVQGSSDFTSPGWTRIGPTFVPDDPQRVIGWYMRPIVDLALEPANYTFSRLTGGRNLGAILVVRGAGGVSGFDPSYAGTGLTTGAPQSRDTAAYPVSTIHSLQLFGAAAEHTAPNSDVPVATPAGFTQVCKTQSSGGTGVSRTSLWVGQRKTDTPASAGVSFTTAGQSLAAESIALRPPTDAIKFATVTDMLAKPGFTWAHRGNSQYYAEESAYAYRQAVARGYVCLEVSLERTSDGVWVLIHDRDINRTSGLAAGTQPNIAAMTWAQVNSFQNTISADNVDQPYARWDDFLAEFGGRGFIFILDPKYTWIDNMAFRTEFWAMCAAAGGPTKVIPKYFIDTTGLATEANNRGYKAWGYAYEATLADGNFATWANAPWAILGMEYQASQASWDTIKGFGKPVVGHIARDATEYTAAMTKGAAGVQVGGSQQVRAINRLST